MTAGDRVENRPALQATGIRTMCSVKAIKVLGACSAPASFDDVMMTLATDKPLTAKCPLWLMPLIQPGKRP